MPSIHAPEEARRTPMPLAMRRSEALTRWGAAPYRHSSCLIAIVCVEWPASLPRTDENSPPRDCGWSPRIRAIARRRPVGRALRIIV